MLDQSYYDIMESFEAPKVRYVVSLSSGITSAVAADMVLKKYGSENVDLVFMDTQWEDDDNYRFLNDLKARWQVPFVKLTEGRKPLEVAKDEHIIPNQKIAPCSKRLKIELFLKYCQQLQADGYLICPVIGYHQAESHRMVKTRTAYLSVGMLPIFPLYWENVFNPVEIVKQWGIEAPRMYKQGYSHANCGGRCVRQGKGDWLRTLTHYPERYEECEVWEREMRKDDRFKDYAFVRHTENGVMRPMTLQELRERHESSLQLAFDWSIVTDETNCFCNAGDPSEVISAATITIVG